MMKRRQMLGLLAACALAFTGSFTGYADPVTYDTTSNASYGGQQFNFDAGTPKLYPGDRVYGAAAIYLGADNAQAGKAESLSKADDGTSLWKDGTAAVYTVRDLTPAADTAQTEMVPLTDENGNPVTNEDGTQAMVPKQVDQQPAGKVYQLDLTGYVVEAVGGTLSGGGGNRRNPVRVRGYRSLCIRSDCDGLRRKSADCDAGCKVFCGGQSGDGDSRRGSGRTAVRRVVCLEDRVGWQCTDSR